MKPQRRSLGKGYPSGSSSWARRHPELAELYKSPKWRWARARQLEREPDCRVCGEKATAVAHVVPIAEGGEVLDPTNLQSLCRVHTAQRGGEASRDRIIES